MLRNIVFFIVWLLFSSHVHGAQFEGVPFKKADPEDEKAIEEEVFSLLEMDEKSEEMLDVFLRDNIRGLFTENAASSHYLEEELHFTTARTIRNTYSENQFRADRLYTDKLLFVKGIVEKIGLKEKGQPVIEFRTGSSLSNTIAYLREEHEDAAIEFNRGETIDLLCVGGGLTGFYSNPTLYDCVPKDDAIEYYYHEAKEAVFAQPNPKYPINLDIYAWFITLFSKEIVLSGGYEVCAGKVEEELCKRFIDNDQNIWFRSFANVAGLVEYFALNDKDAFSQTLDVSESSDLRITKLPVCELIVLSTGMSFAQKAGYDLNKLPEFKNLFKELYENNREFKKVVNELRDSCPEETKELLK